MRTRCDCGEPVQPGKRLCPNCRQLRAELREAARQAERRTLFSWAVTREEQVLCEALELQPPKLKRAREKRILRLAQKAEMMESLFG